MLHAQDRGGVGARAMQPPREPIPPGAPTPGTVNASPMSTTSSRPTREVAPLDEPIEVFPMEPEPSQPYSDMWRKWRSRFRNLRRRVPAWLPRRAWLLATAIFVGAISGLVFGATKDPSYAAQATLAVPSGATPTSPGSSNEADALAINYAAVLQDDDTLLSPAAEHLGVPLDTLTDHLSVSVETGTSVLVLRYTAPTKAEAIRGVNTIANDVVHQKNNSTVVPVSTIDTVQLATSADSNNVFAHYGLEIGLLLGLLVGVTLVLVAERVDPRADTSGEVAEVFDRPVAALPSELSVPEFGHAILSGTRPHAAVTLAPLRWWDVPAAQYIATTLATDHPDTTLAVNTALEEGMAHQLNPNSVIVLVIRSGERMSAVGDVLERLRLMGSAPGGSRSSIEMTSTLDPGHSLTSLSLPSRKRCSRLIPKRPLGRHRNDAILLLCAVALPVVATALGAHDPKFGIGFVLCAALVGAVLVRPVLGGLLLVGLVPFLSGLEPGVLVPNVRLSEALIGVVGLTVLLGTRRLAALRWGALEWLLLGYGLLWAVLGVYDAISLGQQLSISAWGSVIGQLQFFLLYRTVRVTLRTPRQRRAGLGVLLVATVPMAMLAILQEVNVGGLRTSLWDITGKTSDLQTSSIIRATGLFGNWASLAGFFFPLLLVVVALALGGQLRRHRRLFLGLGALMVIGLLLTAELSVIICLLLGVFALGIQYGRFRKMMVWVAVGAAVSMCVVGPVIVQRLDNQFGYVAGSNKGALEPQTVAFRQTVWTQQYLPAIAERPLAGYGLELPSTVQWQYPESQYIALLIEGGYPLLIMYLCLIWGMFAAARRASRHTDPVQRAIGRSLMVTVVALLLLGVIWPFLSNGGLPQVLWCLFALAAPASSRFDRPAATTQSLMTTESASA